VNLAKDFRFQKEITPNSELIEKTNGSVVKRGASVNEQVGKGASGPNTNLFTLAPKRAPACVTYTNS